MPSVLRFKALEEEWGEYVLPNEIRVKTRAVLTFVRQRIGEQNDDGEVEIYHEARSTLNLAVLAPEDRTGDAEENEGEPETVEAFEEEAIETVRNPRSIYYVEETGVFLILEADPPETIEVTDHVDGDGEPVLRVSQGRHLRATEPTRRDLGDKLEELVEAEGLELPEDTEGYREEA